jgi:hypothetical protein
MTIYILVALAMFAFTFAVSKTFFDHDDLQALATGVVVSVLSCGVVALV